MKTTSLLKTNKDAFVDSTIEPKTLVHAPKCNEDALGLKTVPTEVKVFLKASEALTAKASSHEKPSIRLEVPLESSVKLPRGWVKRSKEVKNYKDWTKRTDLSDDTALTTSVVATGGFATTALSAGITWMFAQPMGSDTLNAPVQHAHYNWDVTSTFAILSTVALFVPTILNYFKYWSHKKQNPVTLKEKNEIALYDIYAEQGAMLKKEVGLLKDTAREIPKEFDIDAIKESAALALLAGGGLLSEMQNIHCSLAKYHSSTKKPNDKVMQKATDRMISLAKAYQDTCTGLSDAQKAVTELANATRSRVALSQLERALDTSFEAEANALVAQKALEFVEISTNCSTVALNELKALTA